MTAGNISSETTVPLWIDVSFIQKAHHNAEGGKLKVLSVDVSAALAPGENYSSAIYRVKATLEDGSQRCLIVKIPPLGEVLARNAAAVGFFARETTMFVDVMPKMEALLEEAAAGRFPPFAARCPLHGREPVDFLVLQDLAPAGFKMADRRRGLGLRHCLLALRSLARFHAASHALLQREPQVRKKISNPWNVLRETLPAYVESNIQAAADACKEWPGFEDFSPILEKFKMVAINRFVELNQPKDDEFLVIGHGDFWMNNLMFRYEGDYPVEVRVLDLQISNVGSPALDLLYFLSICPSEEVAQRHEKLLLREYHTELRSTMELLGLQAPSWAWLRAQLQAHGSFALWGALCVVPLAKARAALDLEASLGGGGRAPLACEPAARAWLRRLLPVYRRRGWLQAE